MRLKFSANNKCVVIFIFTLILLLHYSFPVRAQVAGYIDVHMHFTNQVQKQQNQGPRGPRGQRGRPPRRNQQTQTEFTIQDYIECADNMIKIMDRYGIEKAVVMPQPRLSGQYGYYDYQQILPAIDKYPDRLVLGAGGGVLNSMIHHTDADDVTDEVKALFKNEALNLIDAGAVAFAELASLHVSLQPKHVFEEVSPDHPLFLLLADIAAEHGLPVDIHMEAVEYDIPAPENLSLISTLNPDTLKANIPAFERLLAHNRNANIIWQHIGWDNIGHMTITLLSRMLEDHPNLYLGFKVEERPFQMATKEPMPNRMIDLDSRLKDDWYQFFLDYPDRLIVASDQFVGIPGRTVRAPQYMDWTYGLLDQLPPDVRVMVGRENALHVYPLIK